MKGLRRSPIEFPFLHRWDASRYPKNYLLLGFTEDQVQDAILAELEFWQIDAIAIDAGMKRARGRMLAGARREGLDVSNVVNFRSGGLPAGWPDLHGTLAPDGVSIYIEVKAPAQIDPDNSRIIREAGRPTGEQLDFLVSKYERGAIVMVAWSVDDVMTELGDRVHRNKATIEARRR